MSTPLPLPMLSEVESARLPREPGDEPGFGAMATERGRLPLEAMDVAGRVDGLLAQVTVRQRFVNAFEVPLEATYIFPLPDRAAVTRFRMEVAGRVIEGRLDERGRARERYDEALATGHRAAIAEEERPGVYTLRVGNLMPGESATVELTYCGVLPYSDGEVTFRFPLVVAPRYIPGKPLPGPSVGDGTAADTDAVPDASRITPPVLLPGFPAPVRLTLELELHDAAGMVADVRSSLHAVCVEDEPGVRRIRVYPGERLNRDFLVRFRLDGPSIRSALTLHPDADADGSEGTFALTLVPPAAAAAPTRPRDLAFVFDRSGSMEGWKLVAARRALARMIDTLGDADRFLLLAFNGGIEVPPGLGHEPRLVAATDRNRFRAVEYLATLSASGGTEMARPLQQAVDQLLRVHPDPAHNRDRILVLVTDGQVGNEDQILATLGERLGAIRVFTLGIDKAVNEAFLRRLAERGGGTCELVESEDRLDEVMDSVHRRIGTPLLSRMVLEPEGFAVGPESLVPARLPDLFAGSPLLILGRFRGHPVGRLHVRADNSSGGTWSEEVSVVVRDNPAIAAAWARGRIRELEDQYAAVSRDRSKRKLEQTIVALSLKFQVLCRFTAYVAVDHAVTETGDPLHRIIQPVEQPEGWQEFNDTAYSPALAPPSPVLRVRSMPSPLCSFAGGIPQESQPISAGPGSPPPEELSVDACMRSPDAVPSLPEGYEVQGTIGQGGMGTIYRAYDHRHGRIVCIQQVSVSGKLQEDAARVRFQNESRALLALRHPVISQPLDFHLTGDILWIVSAFIEATSLDLRLKAGGPLPPFEAADLVAELAEALQAAHERGIVHGDVKPSNVLIDGAGRPHLVGFPWLDRITAADRKPLGAGAGFLGTVAYAAPEQVQSGADPLDPRRDVYSLGVVLYEVLTRQTPFRGSVTEILRRLMKATPAAPRMLNPKIPCDLDLICLRAMERDPGRRYASAGALAEALRAFRGGQATSGSPSPTTSAPVRPPGPPRKGRRTFWK